MSIHSDLALRLCPLLHTARLTLEPLLASHAGAFFEPLQDDAIYQWISMDKPISPESLYAHWRTLETRMAPDHQTAWATWAVRRNTDGVYVGRVDAEIDDQSIATNVGYYFFPPYWGQGIASEAVTCATEHLISQSVKHLIATVTCGNHASARVLIKAGYDFRRILAGNDSLRGVTVDDEEYVRRA